MQECPLLRFRGLMTMGRLHDIEGFRAMQRLRTELQTALGPEEFVLSMGTSDDFEEAVSSRLVNSVDY